MWRLLLAMPMALLITAGLFMVMAWMVDNSNNKEVESSETIRFDMLMVEQESDLQRRQRRVPEQPVTPELPPQATSIVAETTRVTKIAQPAVPALDLSTSATGLAINAPSFTDFTANQQALPLYRVEPRYPAKALKRGMEGYVVMSFTIDSQGRPIAVKVIDANPRRVFEREAIRALKKWKYQPKVINGKAIEQVGQTVKLEFRLAK